jgi:pimeloyl-ACP methyl ester carboxylesterase
MTFYLNFRSAPVAGSVIDPYMIWSAPPAPPNFTMVQPAVVDGFFGGKDLLFAVHGFNVNQRSAISAFATLDAALALGNSSVMIGVLWPGDWWIPAVNYPFEGQDAMDCGRRLADFCTRHFASARSISFLSHSLGARLVLEAALYLPRRISLVCLTAGAINRDCLVTEYARAAANIDQICALASHEDEVLRLAYPLGDPISNVLHDDHAFFEKALGYDGPSDGSAPLIRGPWQIPDVDPYRYDHGDYLPPVAPLPAATPKRWVRIAEYTRRAFFGQPQVPPSPFPPPQP